MASPRTMGLNARLSASSAETRKRVAEEVAKSHPSKPRTSIRWLGRRTKGMPFSRMKLVEVMPSPGSGRPATFVLDHPTRKTAHRKPATPQLVDVFFPSIPENLRRDMLGAY